MVSSSPSDPRLPADDPLAQALAGLRQDVEKILESLEVLRSALRTWAGRNGQEPDERAAASRRRRAERAVLGCLLLDPELLPEVAERLMPEDFLAVPHRLLFQAMLELQAEGADIDLHNLQGELERQGQLAAVGGVAYVAGLDLDVPDISRIDAYVDHIREKGH